MFVKFLDKHDDGNKSIIDLYEEFEKLGMVSSEYIISAAVYRKEPNMPEESRVMYKDQSKWEEFGKVDDIYFIETARRHPEILHRWREELCRERQGFILHTVDSLIEKLHSKSR